MSSIASCIPWNTHTRLMALCPGLPGWAGTRKVKPIWILLKQETVSGSGFSWAICKSASHSRQITMLHPTAQFLQAGCPSCRSSNSIKALRPLLCTVNAETQTLTVLTYMQYVVNMFSVLWLCWLACKKWVMRCWCGYLSGPRCTLFAYGPADATASQNPIISCLI